MAHKTAAGEEEEEEKVEEKVEEKESRGAVDEETVEREVSCRAREWREEVKVSRGGRGALLIPCSSQACRWAASPCRNAGRAPFVCVCVCVCVRERERERERERSEA